MDTIINVIVLKLPRGFLVYIVLYGW